MSAIQTFSLPDGVTLQQLVTTLSAQFSFGAPAVATQTHRYYDTFDWRLYRKSLVLYGVEGSLFVRKLLEPQPLHQLALENAPRFMWDFPDSPVKSLLAPIVDMRALLPRASVMVQTKTFAFLNNDLKTVVRLAVEVFQPGGESGSVSAPLVRLIPVRGYDDHAARLAEALTAQLLVAAPPYEPLLFALEKTGKSAGDYSGKLTLQLQPEMRSDEAAKVILRTLLNVVKANETGVLEDIDTEFLHDFRVAIRRTRAALSQIREVFPAEITERFKQDFAEIARATNDLRDLDVYLLDEENYRAMLPDLLQDDIAPLFEYLHYKRGAALQNVATMINSEMYARVLADWQMFLNQPPTDATDTPNARRRVINLARERIYNRYRRVAKTGKKILKNTRDEQLHALRIDCKKLRYLLEFFASLFPEDEINLLVKQLKKLQDNLGDFNDLCVQEAYLFHISDEFPASDPRHRHALLAIGSLISTLHQKRILVKNEFSQAFAAFASPKNKSQFEALFSARRDEAQA